MVTPSPTKVLQLNTLLRYKLIKELYDKHKTEDIPDTVVLRKYVRPIYPISRTTLHTILTTPINKLLKEAEERSMQRFSA